MEQGLSAIQTLINKIIEFFVNYSFQVVGAIIILIAGFMIGKWASHLIQNICNKKNIDITLTGFLCAIVRMIIIVFAVIIALGKFGITIAPFIAALGAIAFGATYALQGPLSNYGAGLSIILGRPFIVGNTISVCGIHGEVSEVKLACTILTDEDGVSITIPNKQIVGEILHNSQQNRIAEGIVGISYSNKPEIAIKTILDVLEQEPEITQNPKPQVGIDHFGDSSINISYRYWIPTKKYFQLKFKLNLEIFNALSEKEIQIPFPQREIFLKNNQS